MKKQFYFKTEDSEICHTKEYFEIEMKHEEITEIEVFKAVPEKFYDVFWCRYYAVTGDSDEGTCGKQCKEYKPRNGKNGCCKYYSTILYTHGEKVKLTLD